MFHKVKKKISKYANKFGENEEMGKEGGIQISNI